jgi:hypothetical protein
MDITITLNNTIFCSINSYKDTLYKSRTDSTQKITDNKKKLINYQPRNCVKSLKKKFMSVYEKQKITSFLRLCQCHPKLAVKFLSTLHRHPFFDSYPVKKHSTNMVTST